MLKPFLEESVAKKAKSDGIPKLLDGKYYKIIKRDNFKIEAKCTICGKLRKGDIKSTGNFMEHIRKSHSEMIQEVDSYKKFGNTDANDTLERKQNTIDKLFKKCTAEEVSLDIDHVTWYSRNLFPKFNFLQLIYFDSCDLSA